MTDNTTMLLGAAAVGAVLYVAYQKGAEPAAASSTTATTATAPVSGGNVAGGGLPVGPLTHPVLNVAPESAPSGRTSHAIHAAKDRARVGAGIGKVPVDVGIRVATPEVTLTKSGVPRNAAGEIVITPKQKLAMTRARSVPGMIREEHDLALEKAGIYNPDLKAAIKRQRAAIHADLDSTGRVPGCMPKGAASELILGRPAPAARVAGLPF